MVLRAGSNAGSNVSNPSAVSAAGGGIPYKPQIVTTRCKIPNGGVAFEYFTYPDGYRQIDSRIAYYIGPQNVSQIQVGTYNFQETTNGDIVPGFDYNYRCAIETTAGLNYPLYFNNGLITSVPSGIAYNLSDIAVDIKFAAGSTCYIRQSQFVPVPSYTVVAADNSLASTDTNTLSANTSTTQVYGTGAMSPASGQPNNLPFVIGIPAVPMVAAALLGDSIYNGTGDAVSALGSCGYMERGLESVGANNYPIPHIKQSVSGWQLLNATNVVAPRLRNFWPFCTHLCLGLATNDMGAGTALATMQARFLAVANDVKSIIGPYGKPLKLAATGVLPKTSSTNGVTAATIANGGSGYANSSTFNVTIAGGTFSPNAAIVSVTTNGSGVVTTVNSIVNIGYYTVNPATPNSPSGGAGSGLQLNLTFGNFLDAQSQTPLGGFTLGGIRDQYNSWLQSIVGAGILDYYIDVNSTLADSGTPNVWVTNGTNQYSTVDGTHPSQTGHLLAAPVVTAWALTITP